MRELLLVVGLVALVSYCRPSSAPPVVEATPKSLGRSVSKAKPDRNFFPKIEMPGITISSARLKDRNQVASVCQVANVPFSCPVEPKFVWEGFTTQVFRRGHGPAARDGDTVALRYAAWAGKWHQFESSDERENGLLEYTLPSQAPQTACWLSGVLGMRIGEQRQVIIPAKFFFRPGQKRATLAYDVELVSIR